MSQRCPGIVLCHKGVQGLLDLLEEHDLEQAWKRILGTGRGRRYGDFRHLVAWVERLVREGAMKERAFRELEVRFEMAAFRELPPPKGGEARSGAAARHARRRPDPGPRR